MLSLNIVNIDVRWRQYCRTLAVGNKIISSEKNTQPHLKNGFRNARALLSFLCSAFTIATIDGRNELSEAWYLTPTAGDHLLECWPGRGSSDLMIAGVRLCHQPSASSANMPIVWPSLIAGREFDRFPQSCLRRGCSGVGGEVSIRPRIFQLLNNDPWIMTADWTNIDPAPLRYTKLHIYTSAFNQVTESKRWLRRHSCLYSKTLWAF